MPKKKAAKKKATRKVASQLMPYREHPVPAERARMALRFREITKPSPGQSIDQIGRMFLAAIAERFVPRTVKGLETLIAWNLIPYHESPGVLSVLGQRVHDEDHPYLEFWEFKRVFLLRDTGHVGA